MRSKMVNGVVSILLVCLSVLVVGERDDRRSTSSYTTQRPRFNTTSRSNLFHDAKSLPIEDYIRKHGYPVESHKIVTEDGYILTYHRIPHGKSSSKRDVRKKPVLLQHALLGASSAWVLESYALGYALADAGFDVWLGNARGNTYSRQHVKLDPDRGKAEFWDFSLHEMGYYDLPSSIDYILNVTSHKHLFFMGHSTGTTMYFILGATRPEYMAKVQAAVLMAPVVFPRNIRSPLINFFKRIYLFVEMIAHITGINEVFPYSKFLLWVDHRFCSFPVNEELNTCENTMNSIGGFNDQVLNRTSLSTVLQYLPAGTSLKSLLHFRQITEDNGFKNYDYGFFRNLLEYGTSKPPTYNLSRVTSPIYVYYSENDWLSVPQDVDHTVQYLPNVKKVKKIDDFNHLDFMWANNAKTLVYDDMISTLQNIID